MSHRKKKLNKSYIDLPCLGIILRKSKRDLFTNATRQLNKMNYNELNSDGLIQRLKII